MYNCKYCGFTPKANDINWCENVDCINYMAEKPNTGRMNVSSDTFTAGNMNMHNNMNLPNDASTLAFATVPFQRFEKVLKLNEVLLTGTLFPELYMPYTYKIINRS